MKRFVWLLIGGLVVLLAACGEGEEVGLDTAVPTPLPTIEPTATETAVPVNVLEETAVPTPTIPIETPTPPSPLAEVLDLQTLPKVPVDFSQAYSLKTPDYDFLNDWLRAVRNTKQRGLS